MAHGLQMAEIAQYKKRKAEKQQQEQLAKKKNWGNVMHYKKMYNITGLVGNVTRPLENIIWEWTVLRCYHKLFILDGSWTQPFRRLGRNLGYNKKISVKILEEIIWLLYKSTQYSTWKLEIPLTSYYFSSKFRKIRIEFDI